MPGAALGRDRETERQRHYVLEYQVHARPGLPGGAQHRSLAFKPLGHAAHLYFVSYSCLGTAVTQPPCQVPSLLEFTTTYKGDRPFDVTTELDSISAPLPLTPETSPSLGAQNVTLCGRRLLWIQLATLGSDGGEGSKPVWSKRKRKGRREGRQTQGAPAEDHSRGGRDAPTWPGAPGALERGLGQVLSWSLQEAPRRLIPCWRTPGLQDRETRLPLPRCRSSAWLQWAEPVGAGRAPAPGTHRGRNSQEGCEGCGGRPEPQAQPGSARG